MEFKLGDIVEVHGVRGEISSIHENGDVLITFSDGGMSWYSSVKLIERPKRKITKTVEYWVNVCPTLVQHYLYSSKQAAEIGQMQGLGFTAVKVTGTYEVEEE